MNDFNVLDLQNVVQKTISSFERKTDTTLSENKSKDFKNRQRRKVIKDCDVTPTLFDLLVNKVFQNLENPYDYSQKEIINILYPLKISNKTISRIVNYLIPSAKATQGSIASMIKFINKTRSKGYKKETESELMAKMLLEELTKEFI